MRPLLLFSALAAVLAACVAANIQPLYGYGGYSQPLYGQQSTYWSGGGAAAVNPNLNPALNPIVNPAFASAANPAALATGSALAGDAAVLQPAAPAAAATTGEPMNIIPVQANVPYTSPAPAGAETGPVEVPAEQKLAGRGMARGATAMALQPVPVTNLNELTGSTLFLIANTRGMPIDGCKCTSLVVSRMHEASPEMAAGAGPQSGIGGAHVGDHYGGHFGGQYGGHHYGYGALGARGGRELFICRTTCLDAETGATRIHLHIGHPTGKEGVFREIAAVEAEGGALRMSTERKTFRLFRLHGLIANVFVKLDDDGNAVVASTSQLLPDDQYAAVLEFLSSLGVGELLKVNQNLNECESFQRQSLMSSYDGSFTGAADTAIPAEAGMMNVEEQEVAPTEGVTAVYHRPSYWRGGAFRPRPIVRPVHVGPTNVIIPRGRAFFKVKDDDDDDDDDDDEDDDDDDDDDDYFSRRLRGARKDFKLTSEPGNLKDADGLWFLIAGSRNFVEKRGKQFRCPIAYRKADSDKSAQITYAAIKQDGIVTMKGNEQLTSPDSATVRLTEISPNIASGKSDIAAEKRDTAAEKRDTAVEKRDTAVEKRDIAQDKPIAGGGGSTASLEKDVKAPKEINKRVLARTADNDVVLLQGDCGDEKGFFIYSRRPYIRHYRDLLNAFTQYLKDARINFSADDMRRFKHKRCDALQPLFESLGVSPFHRSGKLSAAGAGDKQSEVGFGEKLRSGMDSLRDSMRGEYNKMRGLLKEKGISLHTMPLEGENREGKAMVGDRSDREKLSRSNFFGWRTATLKEGGAEGGAPFSLEKMGGRWFEIAHSKNVNELARGCECNIAEGIVEGQNKIRSKYACLKDNKEHVFEAESSMDPSTPGVFRGRMLKKSAGDLTETDRKERESFVLLLTDNIGVTVIPEVNAVWVGSRNPTIDDAELNKIFEMVNQVAPQKIEFVRTVQSADKCRAFHEKFGFGRAHLKNVDEVFGDSLRGDTRKGDIESAEQPQQKSFSSVERTMFVTKSEDEASKRDKPALEKLGATKLDLSKTKGKWFLIAVSKDAKVSKCMCNVAEMSVEDKTVRTRGFCLLDGKEESIETECKLEDEKKGLFSTRILKSSVDDAKTGDEHKEQIVLLTDDLLITLAPDSKNVRVMSRKPVAKEQDFKKLLDNINKLTGGKFELRQVVQSDDKCKDFHKKKGFLAIEGESKDKDTMTGIQFVIDDMHVVADNRRAAIRTAPAAVAAGEQQQQQQQQQAQEPAPEPLDLSKLGGRWFEVALTKNAPEANCMCTVIEKAVDGKDLVRAKGLCLKDGAEVSCESEAKLVRESEGLFTYRLLKKSTGELTAEEKKDQKEILMLLTDLLAVKVFPESGVVRIFSRKPEIDENQLRELTDALNEIAPSKLDIVRIVQSEDKCGEFHKKHGFSRTGALAGRMHAGGGGTEKRAFGSERNLATTQLVTESDEAKADKPKEDKGSKDKTGTKVTESDEAKADKPKEAKDKGEAKDKAESKEKGAVPMGTKIDVQKLKGRWFEIAVSKEADESKCMCTVTEKTVDGKTVKSKSMCMLDGKEETIDSECTLDDEAKGLFKYRVLKKSSGDLKDEDKKEQKEQLVLLTDDIAVTFFPDRNVARVLSRKPVSKEEDFKKLLDNINKLTGGQYALKQIVQSDDKCKDFHQKFGFSGEGGKAESAREGGQVESKPEAGKVESVHESDKGRSERSGPARGEKDTTIEIGGMRSHP